MDCYSALQSPILHHEVILVLHCVPTLHDTLFLCPTQHFLRFCSVPMPSRIPTRYKASICTTKYYPGLCSAKRLMDILYATQSTLNRSTISTHTGACYLEISCAALTINLTTSDHLLPQQAIISHFLSED